MTPSLMMIVGSIAIWAIPGLAGAPGLWLSSHGVLYLAAISLLGYVCGGWSGGRVLVLWFVGMLSQTVSGAVSIPAEHAAELSARFLPVVSLVMIPFLALGTIRRRPPESPG